MLAITIIVVIVCDVLYIYLELADWAKAKLYWWLVCELVWISPVTALYGRGDSFPAITILAGDCCRS